MTRLRWIYDDGGRADAGYKGHAGDCVTRAIAIAAGMKYQDVADIINAESLRERKSKRRRGRSSARSGVYKATLRRVMTRLGFTWTPTMQIGSGCKVHMRADELPSTGRLVLNLSKHVSAVIDGVLHDTHDPSRDGMRCVYGYWSLDSCDKLS